MPSEVAAQVLEKVYGISLKTRILGEWAKIHTAATYLCSERQLFTLELIRGFPPITRKSLGIIFGLSPSSVSDMVKKLIDDRLVDPAVAGDGNEHRDGREKPLALTPKGVEYLEDAKRAASVRFRYLFEGADLKRWQELLVLLDAIDGAARRQVERTVFHKY